MPIKENSHQKERFAKDFVLIALVNLFLALKGVILVPIITKILGTEDYGVYSQVFVTISLASPVLLLGLHATLVRFLSAEKDKELIKDGIYSVLSIVFTFSLLVGGFLFFYPTLLSDFFQTSPIIIKILAFVIVTEVLNQIFFAVFRAFGKMKVFSLFMGLQVGLEVILIIVSLKMGFGLQGVLWSLLLSRAFVLLIMFVKITRQVGFKKPEFIKIKPYFAYGLPILSSGFFYWVLQSSDRYLINYFRSISEVGIYAAAYNLGMALPAMLAAIFGLVLPPNLAKHFDEGDMDLVNDYIKYSLKYFLAFSIPVVFLFGILSEVLLRIFSSSEIASGGFLIVPLSALAMLFMGLTIILGQVLALKKKTFIIGSVWFVAALINIALNFFAIPRYSILGAGAVTVISFFIVMVLTAYYARRELKYEFDWMFVLKSIVASGLASYIVYQINPSRVLTVVISGLVFITIYLLILILLGGFEMKEFNLLKKFYKKI
ncbi:MAG: flippase [bacterium]